MATAMPRLMRFFKSILLSTVQLAFTIVPGLDDGESGEGGEVTDDITGGCNAGGSSSGGRNVGLALSFSKGAVYRYDITVGTHLTMSAAGPVMS